MMGIQHILESNNDVCNDEPNSYQDCSGVVHISIFFDGTGKNKIS